MSLAPFAMATTRQPRTAQATSPPAFSSGAGSIVSACVDKRLLPNLRLALGV